LLQNTPRLGETSDARLTADQVVGEGQNIS